MNPLKICAVAALLAAGLAAAPDEAEILFDFEGAFAAASVPTQDARVQLLGDAHSRVLQVSTGTSARWPGITLKAPGRSWDLSSRRSLSIDVANTGTTKNDEARVFPFTTELRELLESQRTKAKELKKQGVLCRWVFNRG